MRLLKTIICAFILIIADQTYAQISDIQDFGGASFTYFSTSAISPSPFLTGRSGAMGSLQFTVRDSTRDMYVNPAKFYGSQEFLISPSITRKSIENERVGSNLYPRNHNSKFSTYILPIGVIKQAGSFYFGAVTSIANYRYNQQNTQRRDGGTLSMNYDGEEEVSGNTFEIISGYRFSESFTIAASYQRTNFSRSNYTMDRIVQRSTEKSYSQSMDFGKLGASLHLFGGETYLLAGLFTSRFEDDEMDSVGNFWSKITGYTYQIEHLHPVSKTFSVGGLIGYEQRDFSNRTSERHFDEYLNKLNTFYFGAGLHRFTPGSEYGIEVVYQPASTELFQDQSFTNPDGNTVTEQQVDFNRLIIRGGWDREVARSLRLQAGLSHLIISDKISETNNFTNVPSENISLTEFHRNVSDSISSTLLSGGFTYRFQKMIFNYYLEINFDGQYSKAERYRNQLLVQYRF